MKTMKKSRKQRSLTTNHRIQRGYPPPRPSETSAAAVVAASEASAGLAGAGVSRLGDCRIDPHHRRGPRAMPRRPY